MEFRLETPEDFKLVEHLTREAFWNVYRPGCSEHLVLHQLRKSKAFIPELDYVVLKDHRIVGHIAYSKMFLAPDLEMCTDVISFGPISVHPDYQKTGIGKALIRYTLEKAKALGYKAVMITGNTNYYHPLGFVSASQYHIHLPGMPLEDPADFFMAKELEKGYLENHAGLYTFDSCFEVEDAALEAFEKAFPPKTKRAPQKGDLI